LLWIVKNYSPRRASAPRTCAVVDSEPRPDSSHNHDCEAGEDDEQDPLADADGAASVVGLGVIVDLVIWFTAHESTPIVAFSIVAPVYFSVERAKREPTWLPLIKI